MILFFFFNDTATTEIYTLSLHDALPISDSAVSRTASPACSTSASLRSAAPGSARATPAVWRELRLFRRRDRSEEHTSELQSRQYLVCRLLLEKKKKTHHLYTNDH